MGRKARRRPDLLGWWKAVLDETKALVDDSTGRLRGDRPSDARPELAGLLEAIEQVNAKLDALQQRRSQPGPEPPARDVASD